VRACYRDAGHILGSAIIEIFVAGKKVVFSGDLGQPNLPVVADPTPIAEADVLLVESTHGNRDHKNLAQTLDEFACALNDTLKTRKGNVIIPAFAVGRRIVDGAKSVRLFGEDYPVRAKVFTIGGLSAHADRSALLGWLAHFARPPRQTWVVHGETLPGHSLCDAIDQKPGWRAAVPVLGQSVEP
jgi:metallo-beta-lactamase family protein